jgi:hypothetical protein
MINCKLVFVAFAWLACTGEGSDEAARPRACVHASSIWTKANQIAARLKGRVLGSLIREGMTSQQVEWIMGKGAFPLPHGGVVGDILFRSMGYSDLGVRVFLIGEKANSLGVDRVTFASLFD